MVKRYALDTRFAIADAFDSGLLSGECTINEIADAVGARRKSIGRTLKATGFSLVRKQYPLKERIPARWAPPRSWPKLKRHSPVTKAIIDLYEAGRWTGRCYVRDLAPLIGVPENSVARALRRLKFKIVRKSHMKFVRMEPAVWAPPYKWSEVFQKQRELHGNGLSTGQVMLVTDLSAAVTDIIEDAVRLLDTEDIPLNKPGELKKRIHKVVNDVWRSATFDNLSRGELASWLGESIDANLQYLQTRVRGYVRFASNRTCQRCGHNPARERENHRA